MDALIYMVTYDGQWDGLEGESPYTWTAPSYQSAVDLKGELEEEFPDRVWSITEKDVS
jgi:hypothetical protein